MLFKSFFKVGKTNVLKNYAPPYKLNLGCGGVYFDGWVNIDSNKDIRRLDLLWDLSRGIPAPDNSCSHIYCEHFLEHLPVNHGVAFLRECFRSLMPGGILRIAMPSLDILLEKANTSAWRDQDWLTWPEYRFIQTRAEMLNISFRWWGHQWLYDREELHRRLVEAGFYKIVDAGWGVSTNLLFCNRETRQDSLLICEAEK